MRVQNQMLVLRIMAAGLLIAGALFTVSPAAADDAEICTNSSGDVAIAACTRAIASGQYTTQNVATLYTSRGNEYAYKGQHDPAIQDFDQAIRLNPQNVSAFIGRGRAYGGKGQHDRAIQDFDQAIRLDAQFARSDRTDPVDVGAGQFMCCRAVLFDCRIKASWALTNIREDAKHCIETCLRNLARHHC
ncbi:MAG: tetratricopeptide repeat protein [Rhizobiales bacterium]|nr:tetratricopeptide repeat protein [Hyphomicrobiales bacterium]